MKHAALVEAVGEHVGLDRLGLGAPALGELGPVHHVGQVRAAVARDPAHDLRHREVLRLAAHLPDPVVGVAPPFDRALDLPLEARPRDAGQELPGPQVQVDRVEQGAPDVVLVLRPGAVADPHGLRVVVAGEVVERRLLELGLAADPVHHVERRAVADLVGDEVEEAVRLEVEPERVEAPQRERRVAHPAVAVVPVPLAAGRLGERGRRRRDQRAGGRVGEALQREGRPLEVAPPRVVGELALVQPAAPEVRGLVDHLPRRLGVGRRRVQRRRPRRAPRTPRRRRRAG